jgi:HEAT repeat protein
MTASNDYIEELGNAGDIAGLLDLLDSEEVRASHRLRRRILTQLGTLMPGGRRIRVGEALTGEGAADPKVIPRLTRLLDDEPHTDVRRTAVWILRSTGDAAATGPLISALEGPDTATRLHAVMGLRDLKAREALPELIGCLHDPRWSVRCESAKALVKIRDERAVQPLRDAAATAILPWRKQRMENAAQRLSRAVGSDSASPTSAAFHDEQ